MMNANKVAERQAWEKQNRISEDIRMMDRPDDWPRLVLPLKRYTGQPGAMPECAILVAAKEGEPRKVYLANLFEVVLEGKNFADCKILEYKDAQAIVADGWLVRLRRARWFQTS